METSLVSVNLWSWSRENRERFPLEALHDHLETFRGTMDDRDFFFRLSVEIPQMIFQFERRTRKYRESFSPFVPERNCVMVLRTFLGIQRDRPYTAPYRMYNCFHKRFMAVSKRFKTFIKQKRS